MRIALVGGSELMAWIVAEVSPPDVEIQHLRRFAAARETLETHPPDAVLFAVTPQRPPWDDLADLCAENQPPIPSAVLHGGTFAASWRWCTACTTIKGLHGEIRLTD